ncbi:MAG: nucleotide exchange factor GrpE [Puniceicoccales bacterium]|jgi:molecular chaperone GrpE|nr:nucleotide exchange factor GrpE [Puniceicoccales bacterium]
MITNNDTTEPTPAPAPQPETPDTTAAAATDGTDANTDGTDDDGTGALAEKLAAAGQENAKLRDLYARAIADLDNYRRRAAREKEDLRKFATQDLVEDLIPILDNLEIGLAAAEKHPEAAPVTDGFKMIATRIQSTLQQHGLLAINPLGEAFDPNAHESVSQTPHDTIPEQHIAAVLRIGYRLHERLVRPASVVLSTGPAAN